MVTINRSNRRGKKYKVNYKGKTIHFGARGYRIFPGTKRGDSYCSRSLGIKGANDPYSANFWARRMWRCSGKYSLRS